jgi:hypothetical protein
MRISKAVQIQMEYAQLSILRDVLVRDLAQAPRQKALWKLISDTEHIWTTAQGDIGFAHTNRGIIRSQGVFDAKHKRWTQRTQSLCAYQGQYTIQPIGEDQEHFFLISLTIQNGEHTCSMTTTIALRSGAIL